MAKKIQKYNRLREVLKDKGMTQAELADKLDIRYVTINRIVNGHREPTLEQIFRIAKVLNIDPCELLNR